jgi:hypothetical protein
VKKESAQVEGEFEAIELEDPRLSRRAQLIAARLAERPELSFPKVFEDARELEGFYRFLRNDHVDARELMAPHVANTVGRIKQTGGPALCVHDTTTFTFGGRQNLGIVEGKLRGFLAHCSVAFGLDGMPLGALRVHSWQRDESKPSPTKLRKQGMSQQAVVEMASEMDRWGESIVAAEALVASSGTLIHLADSEGDDYRLLSLLKEQGCRYVVRGCYDRRIIDAEHSLLKTKLRIGTPLANRSVKLEPRTRSASKRNPPREGRIAELEVRAARVSIEKPKNLPSDVEGSIELNVVHVLEARPPQGELPVEWILLTSEPIDTPEAVLAVVDMYRYRWIIEEFFKALKTGCAYEARQLESFDTFGKALAFFIPVAWGLLRLRALERTDSSLTVEECFTPNQVAVLRAKSRSPVKTVADAFAAIAVIGGHIRNNGRPGWLVLWRGFRDLLLLTQGFALARECLPAYNDQS